MIRLLAVPDYLGLADFDEIFRAILGWDGHMGYIFRVHGQEFNSFRRRTQSKKLLDFQLHRQEKFLYICGAMDLWEWDLRLLEQEAGGDGDEAPICLGGRGAAPPEYCGGPTGYRLMLKRQEQGESMCAPAEVEAVIGMSSATQPDQPTDSWDVLREALAEGCKSLDQRLAEYGPLQPERFSLQETNQRLANLVQRRRFCA